MQSKISFFNPVIFKKNITQYWPVWGAYLLFLLISLPVSLFSYFQNESNYYLMNAEEIASARISYLQKMTIQNLMPTMTFIFALAVAMAVFSYMFQAKSSYTIHALPVCRRSLFITNTASAFCFMVIPQIITFLVSLFICFGYGVTDITYLLHGLILTFFMTVLFLSIAVFSIMVTGNIIAAPIFYIAINFIYEVIMSIIAWFFQNMVYGVVNPDFEALSFLSPYYYLAEHITGSRYGVLSILYYWEPSSNFNINQMYAILGLYSLAGIVIFLLAYLVYRKKQLETTGDMITLPVFLPIIRWIVTFCGASLVTILYYEVFHYEYWSSASLGEILPVFLLSGVVIFFVAEMILQKRFNIFKKWRFAECGGYLIVSAVFVILLEVNGFGLEKKIPAFSQIEKITISGEYALLAKEEDYDDILKLHQTIVDSKDEFESYIKEHKHKDLCISSLNLNYTLKNGTKLSREYTIPYIEAQADDESSAYNMYLKLLDTPQYIMEYHFTNNYKDITFVEGHMDLFSEDGDYESFHLDQAQCQTLAEALQQDILAGNYKLRYYYEKDNDSLSKLYQNTLTLLFRAPKNSYYMQFHSTEQIENTEQLLDCYISLNTDCTYTLQALKDLGIVTKDYQLRSEEEFKEY